MAELQVDLSWENLTVAATSRSGKKKVLLKGITGQVHGGFNAIMGPSGSGKSTLLNSLACRLDRNTTIEGKILLNGKPYDLAYLKKTSSYVMQDDVLNGQLTVFETLMYTAQLRLGPASEAELEVVVNKVIGQMGLEHCRHTIVGDPELKGISGGERKRLCVAMELLTEPSLLFLDEPTSGLDSVTALSLCQTLKRLASIGNCTILCTIHQPQSRIFNLFDSLFLLKAGEIIYQGSAAGALDVYAKAGFPLPDATNPADHLLDVITPGMALQAEPDSDGDNKLMTPSDEAVDVQNTRAIGRHIAPFSIDTTKAQGQKLVKERDAVPWRHQFQTLFIRCTQEQIRRKNTILTQWVETVIIALLIGGVFYQIGTDQKSTVRRQPLLFFCVINQGIFGSLAMLNSFPAERILSLRERKSGTYCASAYFLAKTMVESVTHVVSPALFSCVVYWMTGLQPRVDKFFVFMCFMILCALAATSVALMVSTVARTTTNSVAILPMFLEISRLFGGFFLSPANLPIYFSWLDALSYVKYTYIGISLNEQRGLVLHCTPAQLNAAGACPITSGQQTIRTLGLDYITTWGCALVLILFIIVCRTISYLALRYIKW